MVYAKLMKVSNEVIQKHVYNFKGVEFRLEKVEGIKNNTYYNDSKSTTPDSTIIAIEALNSNDSVLILGGKDKGLNFKQLVSCINSKNNIKLVLLFGQIKDKFENIKVNTVSFNDLDEVVEYIKENIDDKNILFSPATSSFDQYTNYEQRGRHFNRLIKGD